MKIETYVKKNWTTLPKSKFDEKELVIVREMNNDEQGWGHHSYQGIGVDENGNVFEAQSGGCSCSGDVTVEATDTQLNEKWQDVDFGKFQVEFNSY